MVALFDVLVPIRQSIDLGVVEKRVVTVTPREFLCANTHMIVRDKLWTMSMGHVLLLFEVCIQRANPDGR